MISGYHDIRILGYQDIGISGYQIRISYQFIRISNEGHDIRISGYISGYQDIMISYQHIRLSEYQIRLSGCQDIRV
jgi:hypothetical protein